MIAGGKLVIPAKMRRALGIKTGDTMVVDLTPDGDLRVRSLAASVARAQALIREGLSGTGGSIVDDLIAERRAAAEHG